MGDELPWRRWTLIAVGLVLASGCGPDEEPPPKPPKIEEPTVTCEDSGDPNVKSKVVAEVGLKVTDPERDLKTDEGKLSGTLNGVPIELEDPDADSVYTWQPSKKENRMRCDGQLQLVVVARDATGNETTFDEDIQKETS